MSEEIFQIVVQTEVNEHISEMAVSKLADLNMYVCDPADVGISDTANSSFWGKTDVLYLIHQRNITVCALRVPGRRSF